MIILNLGNLKKNNLINEFIRVCRSGGLILLDINGTKGDFAKDRTKKITCLKSKKHFLNLINNKLLKKIFIGEIYKNYSNISDHEYIILLRKL